LNRVQTIISNYAQKGFQTDTELLDQNDKMRQSLNNNGSTDEEDNNLINDEFLVTHPLYK